MNLNTLNIGDIETMLRHFNISNQKNVNVEDFVKSFVDKFHNQVNNQ